MVCKHNPYSAFFGDSYGAKGGDTYNQDKDGTSKFNGHNKACWSKITCHNYGEVGHIARSCTMPDGGKNKSGGGDRNKYPNVNDLNLRCPPVHNNPRVLALSDRNEVK